MRGVSSQETRGWLIVPLVEVIHGPSSGCESCWMRNYWTPLEKAGFEALKSKIVVPPRSRVNSWFKAIRRNSICAGANAGANGRGSLSGWSLAGSRPAYIPFFPQRTRLMMDQLTLGDTDDDGFGAYRTLHASLSVQEWQRLKTIELESFKKCRLDYLELAGIIGLHFECPYGTVARRIKDSVKSFASLNAPDFRSWITGCLLQKTKASTDGLIKFCATELRYTPFWTGWSPYPLECLRIRGDDSDYYSKDGVEPTPAEVIQLLKKKLAALVGSDGKPLVLSIEKFAALDQRELNLELKRQCNNIPTRLDLTPIQLEPADEPTTDETIADERKASARRKKAIANGKMGPTELRWSIAYWKPLTQQAYDVLIRIHKNPSEILRSRWNGNRSTINFHIDRNWTMNSESVGRNGKPLYIPTVSFLTDAANSLNIYDSDFKANQALHDSLPAETRMAFRTIEQNGFENCPLAYIALADVICHFFVRPFGIVGRRTQQKVEKTVCSVGLRNYAWTTACLLQHAKADTNLLFNFCQMLITKAENSHDPERFFHANKLKQACPVHLKELLMSTIIMSSVEFNEFCSNHMYDTLLLDPFYNHVVKSGMQGGPPSKKRRMSHDLDDTGLDDEIRLAWEESAPVLSECLDMLLEPGLDVTGPIMDQQIEPAWGECAQVLSDCLDMPVEQPAGAQG